MKNYKYDVAVFICRCQPPHQSHIDIIRNALSLAERAIVLLGSANQARDIMNPWTWEERKDMVSSCFAADVLNRLVFAPIDDVSNDQVWARSVQNSVTEHLHRDDEKVCLVGHKKDTSSYYLDMFPQWELIEVDNINDMHSTDIRRALFESEIIDVNKIPHGVCSYVDAFVNSETFIKLKKEYDFIKQYKEMWSTTPYPVTFVTVDSVVVCAGHVLLIRRRSEPGRNLWAVPGGFVNEQERLLTAAIRELKEETGIKVPVPVLKGSMRFSFVNDDPDRSLRGRTITHVYVFEIPLVDGKLPKVKGGDDADKAKWISLSTVDKMKSQFFEDHYQMIQEALEKI